MARESDSIKEIIEAANAEIDLQADLGHLRVLEGGDLFKSQLKYDGKEDIKEALREIEATIRKHKSKYKNEEFFKNSEKEYEELRNRLGITDIM